MPFQEGDDEIAQPPVYRAGIRQLNGSRLAPARALARPRRVHPNSELAERGRLYLDSLAILNWRGSPEVIDLASSQEA
jgi:hypothetical protein